MDVKQVKYELQNIVQGTSGASYDALIQAVAGHLRSGTRTGPKDSGKFKNKEQEAARLIDFAKQNGLLIERIPEERFVSSGAEQRVYIVEDGRRVLKLNDAIYYASWEDYFHNLLLHNYFFADTAYRLLGFHLSGKVLYAVVEQPFIEANDYTKIEEVKKFMIDNGFLNTRNNDYEHPDLDEAITILPFFGNTAAAYFTFFRTLLSVPLNRPQS